MADEPDTPASHTLALLRKMDAKIDGMAERFDKLEAGVNELQVAVAAADSLPVVIPL
jgi:hypothetical protein